MTPLTIGEWAAIRAIVSGSRVPGKPGLLAALDRVKPEFDAAENSQETGVSGDRVGSSKTAPAGNRGLTTETVRSQDG